ncbi:MAG: deazaflavin-dependent oxidoreductase (nitroreductase family) [Candidatus Azotimanducaceae bacterium]|jgi:deazaflavin-dependent oxidoreductase (nitroreductase family)
MTNFSEIPWIASHIELYKTDPEKAHHWDSSELGGPGVLPTLLLTTTGRKSGEPRLAPLIYGEHSDSFVIIASKGGMSTHPIWYLNIEAESNCEIQVGARHFKVKARVAEGEERETIWNHMIQVYPPYIEYQKGTDRKIPVVVLDPS